MSCAACVFPGRPRVLYPSAEHDALETRDCRVGSVVRRDRRVRSRRHCETMLCAGQVSECATPSQEGGKDPPSGQ